MANISIVYDTGYDISKDGYTKKDKAFHANGLWGIQLTCDHYQRLLDRNWRRSGKYLYKPHPDKCLSLQYTIRLDVHKFVPSQSHKNLIQRIQTYLQDGIMPEASSDQSSAGNESKKNKKKHQKPIQHDIGLQTLLAGHIFNALKSLKIDFIENEQQIHVQLPLSQQPKGNQTVSKMHHKRSVGDLFFSVMPIFGQLKKRNEASAWTSPGALAQQIIECIKKEESVMRHCEKIEASPNGFINFFLNESSKQVLQRSVETEIEQNRSIRDSSSSHSNETSSSQPSKKQKKAPAHRLDLCIKPACFEPESYELYKKYQIAVHKEKPDKIDEESYTGFLISSPMEIEPTTGVECTSFELKDEIPGLEGLASMTFSGFGGYGSYHVQYRLDGKLFMVGVIDLLPSCLSSVYLYYDPDMMFLKPGVYSALAEILYVKLLSKLLPDLHYYYMGYYIYTCKKMRYKAGYKPSDLLCPVTYTWVPFDQCIETVKRDNDHERVKPEERKLRLAPDSAPTEVVDVSNLDNILCIVERTLVPFRVVRQNIHLPETQIEKLKTFKKLVGSDLSSKMAIILEVKADG